MATLTLSVQVGAAITQEIKLLPHVTLSKAEVLEGLKKGVISTSISSGDNAFLYYVGSLEKIGTIESQVASYTDFHEIELL